MRLLIKQRMFTITDNYYVYGERGEVRYEVETEFFRLGHHIHVYDHRTGQEVGSIHQRLSTFLPEFEIVLGGHSQGVIRKKVHNAPPKIRGEIPGLVCRGRCLWLGLPGYAG